MKTMKKFDYSTIYFALICLVLMPASTMGQHEFHSNSQISFTQPKNTLSYIQNNGQWSKDVLFVVRTSSLDMWITENGVVYDQFEIIEKDKKVQRKSPNDSREFSRRGHVVKVLHTDKTHSSFRSVGIRKLPVAYSYIKSNETFEAQSFESVRLDNIVDGIDVVYYTDNNVPRYDYIVKPFANPKSLRLNVEGAISISANSKDNLTLKTSLGEIQQHGLFVYQNIGNSKKKIECSFSVSHDNTISFNLGEYDVSKPLIIDPLVFSTYIGGSSFETGNGIALDASGNIYVTGTTQSTNFPTVSGSYDVSANGSTDIFVSKFNASGTTLLYSTYIGGSNNDQSNDIAVDGSGNVYITGFTKSTNFPVTSGIFQNSYGGGSDDIFVTKLNSTGTSLVYSTFIGGSDQDIARGLALDASGNVFITGTTKSTNYDITSGVFQNTIAGDGDVFVTKVNSTGAALLYSTYIGGTALDDANDIVIDGSGNAYITGYAVSTNYDVTAGVYQMAFGGSFFFGDAFVTKVNPTGSALVFSTYLGGFDDDFGQGIAIDASNNVYITGYTYSNNYDLQSAFQSALSGTTDAVVTKLNSTGTALLYSTYIGGSDEDVGFAISVNSNNQAIICGGTWSTDYDITSGSFQTTNNGNYECLVTMFSSAGNTLSYSSYFGGTVYDAAKNICLDNGGNPYITGSTESTNFDITSGVYQTTFAGGSDAFVTKFGIGASLTVNSPNTNVTWCAGTSQNITWSSQNVTNVKIDVSTDGGTTFPTTLIASTSASSGSYTWNIPANQTPNSQYVIRVSDASNASVFDVSNSLFTIAGKAIFSVSHSSRLLFPANQSLRTINSTISINGGCSPSWVLKSITSNEADNGVVTNDIANDIQNATFNTQDNSFSLRAERIAQSAGRVYTITYTLTDAGNSRDTSFRIIVPINLGTARDAQQGTCVTIGQNTPHIYTGGSTQFPVTVSGSATIKVKIYNNKGKDIRWIGQGVYSTGTHTFTWNGTDRNAVNVPNGTYFVQVSGDCGTSAPLPIVVARP
ncbi:MAG: SBBP repeat-containing protein [Candidatus Kapaibacterium sp.]|jgi:flagellar hook assembly protein FlgD